MGDRFDRRALVAEVDELSRLLVSGAPQRQLAKRVDVLRRILNGEEVGVVADARRSPKSSPPPKKRAASVGVPPTTCTA
jgi:hypothetical protein